MISKSRLLWLCRRGMKELDDVLIQFVNKQFLLLSEDDKLLFIEFLSYEDPVLFSLIFKESPSFGVHTRFKNILLFIK